MKQFFLTLLFFSAGLICFHPRYDLKAECYGDAAAMYGCGVTPQHQTRGGSLQEFGVGKKPVLPYIGYQGNYNNDDFITVEESRRMMKSIILNRNRANDTSQAAFRAAIGNTGRSIRRSGGSTSRTSGSFFGGGSRRF